MLQAEDLPLCLLYTSGEALLDQLPGSAVTSQMLLDAGLSSYYVFSQLREELNLPSGFTMGQLIADTQHHPGLFHGKARGKVQLLPQLGIRYELRCV